MQINLRGQFLLCRELLPAMKEQNQGRIVNISSVSGKQPLKNRLPYTVSKMGVIGLTRTLAEEVGEHDINVNAVCPGAIDGPRMQRVIKKEAEAEDKSQSEIRAKYETEAARNEMISAEDVADAVVFLCSENASRITGQDINVDAGLDVY
jgi:2-hydroxycyclohexanecarboxyl-CoA dehydrogenase